MRRHCMVFLFLLSIIFVAAADGMAAPGQIVDDATRQWAKEAIAKETSLDFKPVARRIAVFNFENESNSPSLSPLQKGMALMLITDLSKLETVQVVERIKIQALQNELSLGQTGLVDAKTKPQIGKMVGAGYIVGGNLKTLGKNNILISSGIMQVYPTKQIGTADARGEFDAFLRMEKELLFEIIRVLRLDVTPEQQKILEKPFTVSPKAAENYFRGIDSSDKKQFRKAADHFRRAVKYDPAFKAPAMALKEMQSLGLLDRKPRSRTMLKKVRAHTSENDQPTPSAISDRDRTDSIIFRQERQYVDYPDYP